MRRIRGFPRNFASAMQSGPVQFGDDLPCVIVDGRKCASYAATLKAAAGKRGTPKQQRHMLRELATLFESAIVTRTRSGT